MCCIGYFDIHISGQLLNLDCLLRKVLISTVVRRLYQSLHARMTCRKESIRCSLASLTQESVQESWGEIHQCYNSTILVFDCDFSNEKLC